MDEHFIYIVLEIVSEIPKGSVATYKQIAELAGRERNARQVGKILSASTLYGEYPCHRVVNSAGRTAPNWDEQKDLLIDEGVTFKPNGNVDQSLSVEDIKQAPLYTTDPPTKSKQRHEQPEERTSPTAE